jgi:hypothetical protein
VLRLACLLHIFVLKRKTMSALSLRILYYWIVGQGGNCTHSRLVEWIFYRCAYIYTHSHWIARTKWLFRAHTGSVIYFYFIIRKCNSHVYNKIYIGQIKWQFPLFASESSHSMNTGKINEKCFSSSCWTLGRFVKQKYPFSTQIRNQQRKWLWFFIERQITYSRF